MESLDFWLCIPGAPRTVAFYFKAVSLRSRNAHVDLHHLSPNRHAIQANARPPVKQVTLLSSGARDSSERLPVRIATTGIIASYETVRQWCRKFGSKYARTLKRRQSGLGDTWHLDEVFVTINGQRQYLWRAVDHDGDVFHILVQPRRNQSAAERFFRKLLKGASAIDCW
jgi:DDE domain